MSDDVDALWQVGEFVTVSTSLGVAVPLPAVWSPHPDDVGLDHVGVWYGQYDETGRPLVRTVPIEVVARAAPRIKPTFRPAYSARDREQRLILVADQIPIGKTGRITGGRSDDVGWFVRVEPARTGRDIGFFIITSTNRDFVSREPDDAVYDNWVMDELLLHQYFAEAGYLVEWLD